MLFLKVYFVLCCLWIKKIVLPTKTCYLIKCCWWMKKIKLVREWCDKKPSQKNGHKTTIGTDFNQFCAACELFFLCPIKCCSRICNIKKCCLGINKKINAAQEFKIYKKSDLALSSLQSAAARWHQGPSWPYNHVFKKSRYLKSFFNK